MTQPAKLDKRTLRCVNRGIWYFRQATAQENKQLPGYYSTDFIQGVHAAFDIITKAINYTIENGTDDSDTP